MAEKISYNVTMQGAPVVNSMGVVCCHNDVAVLNIDMKSKYCAVSITGSEVTDGCSRPLVWIAANERSLYLHKKKKRDDVTEIRFLGLDGFTVMATGDGRYDISVCLVDLGAIRKKV